MEDTVQLEVKLSLPGSVAREATASGLLRPEFLEALVREELRRRRVERLFQAADRLADLGGPDLAEEEIEAEIRAAREQRRRVHASGS